MLKDVNIEQGVTMKIKKILSAVICLSVLSSSAVYAESTAPDLNSDGKVNVCDLLIAKRKNKGKETVSLIRDFLLGKSVVKTIEETYPKDLSAVLEPKGTIHYGEGTFYGGGYEGGCAMLEPISKDDYWICAMNIEDYNNAQLAGAYIELTGELGTINMFVSDLLPEGKKGDIDLYVDAFPLIAPVEKGRVNVSWKIIPLDSADKAPMSYKFKGGSSPFWCSVQVRNHRYPVAKLEYLNENGEFIELPRRHYNYFESDKMGAGPFTFRVTDIYGDVIVDKDIPLVEDGISQGKAQFPL